MRGDRLASDIWRSDPRRFRLGKDYLDEHFRGHHDKVDTADAAVVQNDDNIDNSSMSRPKLRTGGELEESRSATTLTRNPSETEPVATSSAAVLPLPCNEKDIVLSLLDDLEAAVDAERSGNEVVGHTPQHSSAHLNAWLAMAVVDALRAVAQAIHSSAVSPELALEIMHWRGPRSGTKAVALLLGTLATFSSMKPEATKDTGTSVAVVDACGSIVAELVEFMFDQFDESARAELLKQGLEVCSLAIGASIDALPTTLFRPSHNEASFMERVNRDAELSSRIPAGTLHLLSVLISKKGQGGVNVPLSSYAGNSKSRFAQPSYEELFFLLFRVLRIFDLSILDAVGNLENQEYSKCLHLHRKPRSGDPLVKTSARHRDINQSSKFSPPLLFDALLKTSRAAKPSARKAYEHYVEPQQAKCSLPISSNVLDKSLRESTESKSVVPSLPLKRRAVLQVVILALVAFHSLTLKESHISARPFAGIHDHSMRDPGIIRPLTKLLVLQGRDTWNGVTTSFVRQKACSLLLRLIGTSSEAAEEFMAHNSGIGSMIHVLAEFPEDHEINHLSKAAVESLEIRSASEMHDNTRALMSVLRQRAKSARKANSDPSGRIEYRLGYAALESKSSRKCIARPQTGNELKPLLTEGDHPQIQCDHAASDEVGKLSPVEGSQPRSQRGTDSPSGFLAPKKSSSSPTDRKEKFMTGYAESKKRLVYLATQEVRGLEKGGLDTGIRRLHAETVHRTRVFPTQHDEGPNNRGVFRRRPASAQMSRGAEKLKPVRPTSASPAAVRTETQEIQKHIPALMKAKGEKGQIPVSVVRRLRKEKVDRVRSGASLSSQDRDTILTSDLEAVRNQIRSRYKARETTGGAGALKSQGLSKTYRKKAPPLAFSEASLCISDEEQDFLPSPKAPSRLEITSIEAPAETPILLARSEHAQHNESSSAEVGDMSEDTPKQIQPEVLSHTSHMDEILRQDNDGSRVPNIFQSIVAPNLEMPDTAVVECAEESSKIVHDDTILVTSNSSNESIESRLSNLVHLSRHERNVLLNDLVKLAQVEEGNKEYDEHILEGGSTQPASATDSIPHSLQFTVATQEALTSRLNGTSETCYEALFKGNVAALDSASRKSIEKRLLNLRRLSKEEKKLLLRDLAKLARDERGVDGGDTKTSKFAALKAAPTKNSTLNGVQSKPPETHGQKLPSKVFESVKKRLLKLGRLSRDDKVTLLGDLVTLVQVDGANQKLDEKDTQEVEPRTDFAAIAPSLDLLGERFSVMTSDADAASAKAAPHHRPDRKATATLESRLLSLSTLKKNEKLALLDECAQEVRRSESIESPADKRSLPKTPAAAVDVDASLESRLRGLDGLSVEDKLKLVHDFAEAAQRFDNPSVDPNAKSLPASLKSIDSVRTLRGPSEENIDASTDSITAKPGVHERTPHSNRLPHLKENESSEATATASTIPQVASIESRLLRLGSLSRHEKHDLLNDLAEAAHQEIWKTLEYKLTRLSHFSKSDKLLLLWEIAHEVRRTEHPKELSTGARPEVREEPAELIVNESRSVDITPDDIASRLLSFDALSADKRMRLLTDCAIEAHIDAIVKTLNKSGDGAISKADFKRELHNPSNSSIEDQLYSIFGLSGVISDKYALEILDAVFDCMDELKCGKITRTEIREFVSDVDYFVDIWETTRGTSSLAPPTQEWIDELDVESDESLSHNTVIFGFKDHPQFRTLARNRRQTGVPSKHRMRKFHAKPSPSLSTIPALPVQTSRSPSPSLEATTITPQREHIDIPEPSTLLRSVTSFERLSDVDQALPTVALNLETRLQHLGSLSTAEKLALLEDFAREVRLMEGGPKLVTTPKAVESVEPEKDSQIGCVLPNIDPSDTPGTNFRSDVAMITLGTFSAEAARMSIEERLLQLSSLPHDAKHKLLADLVTLAQNAAASKSLPDNESVEKIKPLVVRPSNQAQNEAEASTGSNPVEAARMSIEKRLLQLSSLPHDAKHKLLADLVTLARHECLPDDESVEKIKPLVVRPSNRAQNEAEASTGSNPVEAAQMSLEERLLDLSSLSQDAKEKLLADLVTLARHEAATTEVSGDQPVKIMEPLAVQASNQVQGEVEVSTEFVPAEAVSLSIEEKLLHLSNLPHDAKHKLLADLVILAHQAAAMKDPSGVCVAAENINLLMPIQASNGVREETEASDYGVQGATEAKAESLSADAPPTSIEDRLLNLSSLSQDAKLKLLAGLVTLTRNAAAPTDAFRSTDASVAISSESISNKSSADTTITVDQVDTTTAAGTDCDGGIFANKGAPLLDTVSISPIASAPTAGVTETEITIEDKIKEVLKDAPRDVVAADTACKIVVSTPVENAADVSSNPSDAAINTSDDHDVSTAVNASTASALATATPAAEGSADDVVTTSNTPPPDVSGDLPATGATTEGNTCADAYLAASSSSFTKPLTLDPPIVKAQEVETKQKTATATNATTTTARVLSAFSALPSLIRGGATSSNSKFKQAAKRAHEAAAAHQAKVNMVRVKATQRQAERDQQELAEMIQGMSQAREEKKIQDANLLDVAPEEGVKKKQEVKEAQAAEKATKVSIEDEIAAINTKLKAASMIQRLVRHRRVRAAAATVAAQSASERFMWAEVAQEQANDIGSMDTEESSTESSLVSVTNAHGTEANGQAGTADGQTLLQPSST